MKKLTAYQLNDNAPKIIPAVAERDWMAATQLRFAYRCLPLTIANSMGWEILCRERVEAEWNGGEGLDDISIISDEPEEHRMAVSHFGNGVLTFRIAYLFRTEPGVGLWVRGSPNLPKDGIAPLDGIVETDWLSFTFTMNWKFTRPCRVAFEKDEPICFLTPVHYHGLDDVEPEIRSIHAEPELAAELKSYGDQRKDFNAKLAAGDPETLRKGWQKWYMRGQQPSGENGNPAHLSKLRLAAPKVVEGAPPTPLPAEVEEEAGPPGMERIDHDNQK